MRTILISTVLALCGAGAGLFFGFRIARSAGDPAPPPHRAEHSSASPKTKDDPASRERRDRITRFPTVIMECSRMPDYAASPYPDWLIKVRCRGVPGDLARDFLAVFQCVGGRKPLVAADLRKGMRLSLTMVPIEDQPAQMKTWPMADDADDFSLPVFWVRDFDSADPIPRFVQEPARAEFARLADESVLKATAPVPAGSEKKYFYFYGSNWGIYKPNAEKQLTGIRPGSPCSR